MLAIDLILNLKGLNHYATYHHFKMDTLYPMLKLVETAVIWSPLISKMHIIGWRLSPSFHVEQFSVPVYMFAERAFLLPT